MGSKGEGAEGAAEGVLSGEAGAEWVSGEVVVARDGAGVRKLAGSLHSCERRSGCLHSRKPAPPSAAGCEEQDAPGSQQLREPAQPW